MCDAVVRFIEARDRTLRADVTRPEDAGGDAQVDLCLRLGSQRYAIEHTRIEAFPSQVRADQQFAELIVPVKAALSGTLHGDAVYDLHLPLDCDLGRKSAGLRQAQDALGRWVREVAERLSESDGDDFAAVRHPERGHSCASGKPAGFPYEVALHRWARSRLTRGEPGSLDVARVAPEDLESARKVRVRKALEDKCPKLGRCKIGGARTVLVLESSDLPLSNAVLIREVLAPALDERQDVPDEVYLVETESDHWFVYLLAVDGECARVGAASVMEVPEGDLLDLRRVARDGRRPAQVA